MKCRKYQAKEEALTEEVQAEQEKQKELSDYEQYTKTDDYTESTAKSKLGLVYDNEIVFREK